MAPPRLLHPPLLAPPPLPSSSPHSSDPLFNIEVIASEEMMKGEGNVERAIEHITKAVMEGFPEVPAERILIFFRAHDPAHAGYKGMTMSKYSATFRHI